MTVVCPLSAVRGHHVRTSEQIGHLTDPSSLTASHPCSCLPLTRQSGATQPPTRPGWEDDEGW